MKSVENKSEAVSDSPGATRSKDLLASVVVFLVALPLCMGISIASGAPPAAGLISGVVGGLLVGALSGSPLQVTGPAAGLSVIVFDLVNRFGFQTVGVLCAMAGVLQIVAGAIRIGQWFRAVPPSVIHGMLSGIGVLIFCSQFHVMVDDKPLGSGLANLLGIPGAIAKGLFPADGSSHHLAAMTGLMTLMTLVLWTACAPKRLKLVPAPLAAVTMATLFAWILKLPIAYVSVPKSLFSGVQLPADLLSKLAEPALWMAALAVAAIASAETLLTAVAVDAMQQRAPRTDYNRELLAQGTGNLLCGLIGGLPLTGVIVRSKANVDAGAETRLSAVLHGVWMLAFVVLFPALLTMIPVASLAAVLVFTGYKLVNPTDIRRMAAHGRSELAIFWVTVATIVGADLLKGVVLGLVLAALKLLYMLSHVGVHVETGLEKSRRLGLADGTVRPERLDGSASSSTTTVILEGFATFLVLPTLATDLEAIPGGSVVVVRTDQLDYVDHACLDLLRTWQAQHEASGGRVDIDWRDLGALFHNGGRWHLDPAESVTVGDAAEVYIR